LLGFGAWLFGHPCAIETECTLKVKPSEQNRVNKAYSPNEFTRKKYFRGLIIYINLEKSNFILRINLSVLRNRLFTGNFW
jgi:hypothetical protein